MEAAADAVASIRGEYSGQELSQTMGVDVELGEAVYAEESDVPPLFSRHLIASKGAFAQWERQLQKEARRARKLADSGAGLGLTASDDVHVRHLARAAVTELSRAVDERRSSAGPPSCSSTVNSESPRPVPVSNRASAAGLPPSRDSTTA